MTDELYKKEYGQYFTITNPFKYDLFKEWSVNICKDDILLEPFAGSNNIVSLMKETGFDNDWCCYDIDTDKPNKCPEYTITENDSINNFPQGFNVAITNPPYLSRVSATKMGVDFPDSEYADLYMVCLDRMLDNCKYVAAIIPESFITQNLFIDRLYGIVSLNIKMFDDTECPVCLALFSPSDECKSQKIYIGNEYVGELYNLAKYNFKEYDNVYSLWAFNDPDGNIGVKCIDNNIEDDIKFMKGELINPSDIKISSRMYTRISGQPDYLDIDLFIEKCNDNLKEYRENTKDVFMTSFRGLRKDNKYRRRIDFKTVRWIMNKSLIDIKGINTLL